MAPNAESPDTADETMISVESGCLVDNFVQDVLDVLDQLDCASMPVVDSFRILPYLLGLDSRGAPGQNP
jgi:hypothetical protein